MTLILVLCAAAVVIGALTIFAAGMSDAPTQAEQAAGIGAVLVLSGLIMAAATTAFHFLHH